MELPSGTVTFLFTDIEGSTRLLHELGPERYGKALADHRRLVRTAFAEANGREMDTQGDAFFVAFARASDAVAAAAAAQRALADHPWPDGSSLRVRMGIHTGEPTVAHEGYVGVDVHRGARICAAGHGGQVLVSESTRRLLSALPDGVALRELGAHRLKDLSEPQPLYQLVIAGLRTDFPALKTLENRATNLPAQLAPVVGRAREVAEAAGLLRRDDVRLVTLTGPGGTGKTTLALQVAAELVDDFADGVFVVSLAAITEPELVLAAIGRTLGLEESEAAVEQAVSEYLGGRQLLLVLDNFEQVSDAAPLVSAQLAGAPNLKVLATSRSPLHVTAEHEYPVAPLPADDALALFVARAQAAKPGFALDERSREAVEEICRRLDGLPLAVELAAARVKLLPPPALLARLEQSLKVLTGGARDLPERQQTLRGAIEWSFRLLEEPERALFARLAVFSGGFRLESAEAVCDPSELDLDVFDGVASLVDKSLLRQDEDPDGEPRFSFLATIREYARERLADAGEDELLSHRHAEYFVALAEEAREAARSGGDAEWFPRIEADHDNIRAALEWTHAAGECALELRLAAAMGSFWWIRGYLTEGRRWLEQALAATNGASPAARATTLINLCGVARLQGDTARARTAAEEALGLYQALDDRLGVLDAKTNLANVAGVEGDYVRCAELLEESLAIERELGDAKRMAVTLATFGSLALAQGDYESAESHCRESLALQPDQSDNHVRAVTRFNLASALLHLGRVTEAGAEYANALELLREAGDDAGVLDCLVGLAGSAVADGRPRHAAVLLGAADALRGPDAPEPEPSERELHDRTLASARSA